MPMLPFTLTIILAINMTIIFVPTVPAALQVQRGGVVLVSSAAE